MRFADDPAVREGLDRVRRALLSRLRAQPREESGRWISLADAYLVMDPCDDEVRRARESRSVRPLGGPV